MKSIVTSFFCLIITFSYSQIHNCQKSKLIHFLNNEKYNKNLSTNVSQIMHEFKYDLNYAQLNLNMEKNTKDISGNVLLVAKSNTSNIDTFMCLIHQNYTITSVQFNGASTTYYRKDSALKIIPTVSLSTMQSFSVLINYQGVAPTFSGSYNNGYVLDALSLPNTQMSWTFAEPFLAYHWWPCKQVVTDKLDSSKFFITTDSSNTVASNGLLKNVVTIGNKKRFEWHNNQPIAYYLIAAAISKFTNYNIYSKPQFLVNDSILVQNFIPTALFTSSNFQNGEKLTLNKCTKQIELFSNLFGMYPFYKQKYGHFRGTVNTGGMENQTMSFVENFNIDLMAHELAHHWWGNNVTCKGWQNIFINEAFATYSEFLNKQYLDSLNYLNYLNLYHNYVLTNNNNKIEISGSDTLNPDKIFTGELYIKGGLMLNTLRFITNNDSLWFNTLRTFQNIHKNSNASVEDFRNHYQTVTGINPTIFFNQWFSGAGYPIFNVKYFKQGNNLILKSTQSTSTPTSVALFQLPMEYKINRSNLPDTVIRVNHLNTTEIYNIAISGNITSITVDPKNWVINKTIGPILDSSLVAYIKTNNLRNEKPLKVYPIPAKSLLNIECDNCYKLSSIIIHNLLGELVYTKYSDNDREVIDITGFKKGIYILHANNQTNKVIIE